MKILIVHQEFEQLSLHHHHKLSILHRIFVPCIRECLTGHFCVLCSFLLSARVVHSMHKSKNIKMRNESSIFEIS